MNITKRELKNWIAGSPEQNTKELKWQLIDMGVYAIDEAYIAELQEEIRKDELAKKCRCPDDSGSCDACLEYYK